MAVRLVVHLSIEPKDRQRFRDMVRKVLSIVREKEAGRTVAFEFNATDPDALSYLVHEAYADADAWAAHGQHMAEQVPESAEICKFDWGYVTGELSEALAAQVRAGGPNMHYYGHAVAQL